MRLIVLQLKHKQLCFECMSEKQVTVDGTTYLLQPPFLVFATQNPIEQKKVHINTRSAIGSFLCSKFWLNILR